MDNFSVTVAIPCYNGEKFLSENIISLLRQTRVPDEILVVDDGSSDRSSEIAEKFRQIKLIRHQSNLGLAESRNTALKNASGNIIIYLDADTTAHPKLIETLIKGYSEENKEKVETLGIVVGNTDELDLALKQLVLREIYAIENQSLTDFQVQLLSKIEEDYSLGFYSEALEKILALSNNR